MDSRWRPARIEASPFHQEAGIGRARDAQRTELTPDARNADSIPRDGHAAAGSGNPLCGSATDEQLRVRLG